MGKAVKKEYPVIGWNYGKSDMTRCGLFAEMSYLEGKPYVSPYKDKFNENAYKGLQMHPGGPKTKCGLQDGYFEPKFNRIFEKEALTDPYKLEMQRLMKESTKNICNNPMLPGSPTKLQSSKGDYYGTFISKMPAFSPQTRPEPKKGPWLPSIMTSPSKFFGCGYKDITIGPYPEYSSSPYTLPDELKNKKMKKHNAEMLGGAFLSASSPKQYFGPNPYYVERVVPTYKVEKKKNVDLIGGPFLSPGIPKDIKCLHIGYFSQYPEHKADVYLTREQVKTYETPKLSKFMKNITAHRMAHGQPFNPPNKLKTARTRSIVNYNIDFKVNDKNWKTFKGLNRQCKNNQ